MADFFDSQVSPVNKLMDVKFAMHLFATSNIPAVESVGHIPYCPPADCKLLS